MDNRNYRVMLETEDAKEFFCCLLSRDKRQHIHHVFDDYVKVIAYSSGSLLSGDKVTSRKNDTLIVYSNLIPSGIQVEYSKGEPQSYDGIDKIIFWQTFPIADNQFLKRRILNAKKDFETNPFLQLKILLYSGRVRTGATDLLKQEFSEKKSKAQYAINYSFCNLKLLKSEQEFRSEISSELLPEYKFDTSNFAAEVKNEIDKIKSDIEAEKDYFSIYCDLPVDENDRLMTPERTASICKWENVANSDNVMLSYFKIFIQSKEYVDFENKIINYYTEKVNPICIWSIAEDTKNLRRIFNQEINSIVEKMQKKGISAPDTKIKYNSGTDYTKLKIKFADIIDNFYMKNIKKLVYKNIEKKISILEGILK